MNGELEKTIELLEYLIQMRAIDCDSANRSVRFVYDYLMEQGLEPGEMEHDGHLMLHCRIGAGKHTLILNGHLDVVEGHPEQFTPRMIEDRLYGRGSYDMLAACAVMIRLMCEYKENPPDLAVILTLSSTEETDGKLCTGYLLDHGIDGDFAICGEPTNLAVSIMSKGVFRFRAEVCGKAAHSSRPWQGENALLKAYDIYNRIQLLPFARQKNKYFDGASINLSKMSGGVAMNQVPDLAEVTVDIRYLPGAQPEDIKRQLEALDSTMKLEITALLPPVELEQENIYLKMLQCAVNEATGQDCICMAQHGAADTAFFQMHGIPSVEFGPLGAGHHGPEEYVVLSSLETFRTALKNLAAAMAK